MTTRKEQICVTALRLGMPEAARRYGVTVPYISKIFGKEKLTIFAQFELCDGNGKERNFKQLRTIFNEPV